MENPRVIIVMGSDSDLPQMAAAAQILEDLQVPFGIHVSSAHRTPEKTHQIVAEGEKNGAEVFIAAAGGAAVGAVYHRPVPAGQVLALLPLPYR